MYFLAINRLKSGLDPKAVEKVIPAHIQWLEEQISSGSVVQAGKWGDFGGMVIVKEEGLSAVNKLLKADPLAKSALISTEVAEFSPHLPLE